MTDIPQQIRLRCPACRTLFDYPRAICGECKRLLTGPDGIVDARGEAFEMKFGAFLASYTKIRLSEGRGADGGNIVTRLPDCPVSHPHARQWQIRQASFEALCKVLDQQLGGKGRVLDLGGGNGWLSYRLMARGYICCTVDLSRDDDDGLGATHYFGAQWPLLQGSFDNLGVADEQVEAVVYNASFHYSANYEATLREALRVTTAQGCLYIIDTPIYKDGASGRVMLQELHDGFEAKYGDRSDSLNNEGYLTWARIGGLCQALELDCQVIRPRYNWRWRLRPLLARLRGQREPATFAVLQLSRKR